MTRIEELTTSLPSDPSPIVMELIEALTLQEQYRQERDEARQAYNDLFTLAHTSFGEIADMLDTLAKLQIAQGMPTRTLDETNNLIVNQVYKAMETLGADSELLSLIGSWNDTLDDSEVLELLTSYNETGTCFTKIICQVGDTPKDRRSRFELVKGTTEVPGC